MRSIVCKGIVGILLSILVLSCKKDSDTGSSSTSAVSSGGGSTSSTVTARYTQNATLETYTALWCGWCPAAKTYTNAAVAQYGANVIPMEFHNNDALTPAGEPTLEAAFSVSGYPSQFLNRNIPYNANLSQIASLVTTSSSSISSTVGLAINSSLNGTSLSISVKSRFAQSVSGTKLVVYVLESGIVASHANDYSGNSAYSSSSNPLYVWYIDPDPIANYINDNVVRTSASAILGDAIPTQAGASEYDQVYTVSVPSTWNSSSLSIVAMVVQANNNVLNAQQAKVGQVQNFQILVP